MKEELKACPFCGEEAELHYDKYTEALDFGGEHIPEFDEWYVQCKKCFMVPNSWGNGAWSSKDEAIKAWNLRPEQRR